MDSQQSVTTTRLESLTLPALVEFLKDDDPIPLPTQRNILKRRMNWIKKSFGKFDRKYKRNSKKQQDQFYYLEKEANSLETSIRNQIHYLHLKKEESGGPKERASYESIAGSGGRTAEDYQREIERTKVQIESLNDEIIRKKKDMLKKVIRTDGVGKSEVFHVNLLVTKCDKKLHDLYTKTDLLRAEIESLIKYRNNFMEKYNKQEALLCDLKQKIHEVVEEGNQLYDERDLARQRLTAVELRNQMAIEIHSHNLKDIAIMLTSQKQMNEFLYLKTNERNAQKLEEVKQIYSDKFYNQLKVDEEAVAYHEKALRLVKELAGEEDIDNICTNYELMSKDNFNTYNNILHYKEELSRIQAEKKYVLQSTKKENKIGKFFKMGEHGKLEKADKNFTTLSFKLVDAQTQLDKKKQNMEDVKEILSDIFGKYQFKKTQSLESLLPVSEITHDTLPKYVRILERKCQRLLDILNYYEDSKNKLEAVDANLATIALSSVHAVQSAKKTDVEPVLECSLPDTDSDWPDEEDEENEIFTIDDLQKRAEQNYTERAKKQKQMKTPKSATPGL